MKKAKEPSERADTNNGRWGTGVYMYDCIHLKACRRQRAIYGKQDHPMFCNVDCTAYTCGEEECITVSEAVEYARQGASSIRSGYDEYDVYSKCDFTGRTLKDIVNDIQGGH